jgi:hypothetical protein
MNEELGDKQWELFWDRLIILVSSTTVLLWLEGRLYGAICNAMMDWYQKR